MQIEFRDKNTLKNIFKNVIETGEISNIFGFDENKIEAIYAIGYSQYINGKYYDAINNFQIILTVDSMNIKARNAFASCLYMLKKYNEAMEQFALVVYMEPKNPDPIFNVAECMIAIGKKNEAKEILLSIKNEFNSEKKHKKLMTKVTAIYDLIRNENIK